LRKKKEREEANDTLQKARVLHAEQICSNSFQRKTQRSTEAKISRNFEKLKNQTARFRRAVWFWYNEGMKVRYNVRESTRAKNVSITVELDGSVVVVKPIGMRRSVVEEFIKEKKNWIFKTVKHFQKLKEKYGEIPLKPIHRHTRKNYLKHKEEARRLMHERVKYFNRYYNFPIKKRSTKQFTQNILCLTRLGNINPINAGLSNTIIVPSRL